MKKAIFGLVDINHVIKHVGSPEKEIYALTLITEETPLGEIRDAEYFVSFQGEYKEPDPEGELPFVDVPDSVEEDVPEEAVEKKADSSKAVKFDMSKAIALYGTGWSVNKIADELGVSYSTAYRRLREAGII